MVEEEFGHLVPAPHPVLDQRLLQPEPLGRQRLLQILQRGLEVGQRGVLPDRLRHRLDDLPGGIDKTERGTVGAEPYKIVADLLLPHPVHAEPEGRHGAVHQLLTAQPRLVGHRVQGARHVVQHGLLTDLDLDPGQRRDGVQPTASGQDVHGGVGEPLAAAVRTRPADPGPAGQRDVTEEPGHPRLVDQLARPHHATHRHGGALVQEDGLVHS